MFYLIFSPVAFVPFLKELTGLLQKVRSELWTLLQVLQFKTISLTKSSNGDEEFLASLEEEIS